ncbi:MAG: hypothetical protein QM811_11355 [Pirellulales bacterium]
MTRTGCGAADPHAHRSPLLHCKLLPAVDWASLDVRLPSPSQPRHVLKALENSGLHVTFAEPLDAPESSRRFRLRVQDPAGPDVVLQGLHRALKIGEDNIKVHGLEVALDAYVPGGSDDDDLVTVAAHMLWATATPPPGRLWITGEGKGNSWPADKLKPAEIRRRLAGPYSGNIGNVTSHREGLRIYTKRSDTSADQQRINLPADQQRARMERWFLNDAVPFEAPTLAGWRTYQFTDLAKHFAQVRVNPAASPLGRLLLEQRTAQLGQPVDPRARASKRRQSRPSVVRDTEVNEAIRVAFRRLTTAQRAGNLLKF